MLGSLGLNLSTFWAQDPNPAPTIGAVCGETRALRRSTFSYGGFERTKRSLLVLNVKTNFSILNEGGIGRSVCIPRILVGANLKAGVTFLMRRILEACSWRLTVYTDGYAVNDGERPPRIPTLLPTMIGMAVTSPDQGLPLASLSCMMKIIIISAKHKNSSRKGLGNNAMNRALNQISKSSFARKIEKGKLPRQFT